MPNVLVNFPHINVSLQVDDIMYYCPTNLVGGFDDGKEPSIIMIGPVVSIDNDPASTTYGDVVVNWNGATTLPSMGDFLMFAKDKRANTSSMIGYYALTRFQNFTDEKAELFSVGSEIFESSK
tara:strand:- start:188 stop:556 length:369 start_codon:yes stop_codon:yes gene_type:complete